MMQAFDGGLAEDIDVPTYLRLGGRFGYFLFFLLGGGEGGSEAPARGQGSVLSIENTRRGGSPRRGGGGPVA